MNLEPNPHAKLKQLIVRMKLDNDSLINSQYIHGDINLILTSPHGGEVIPDPDYMRDRRPGCYDEATGVCTYDSSLLDCESSVKKL